MKIIPTEIDIKAYIYQFSNAIFRMLPDIMDLRL